MKVLGEEEMSEKESNLWDIYFPVFAYIIGYFLAWAQLTDHDWRVVFHYSDFVALTGVMAGFYVICICLMRLKKKVKNMIEPSAEMVGRAISMGFVVRVGGGYDYSEGFKQTAKEYISQRHGFMDNARMQRAIADLTLPVFVAYPETAKKRDLLLTIAIFVTRHAPKIGYDPKRDRDSVNLLYTLLYLDQQIPDVVI